MAIIIMGTGVTIKVYIKEHVWVENELTFNIVIFQL